MISEGGGTGLESDSKHGESERFSAGFNRTAIYRLQSGRSAAINNLCRFSDNLDRPDNLDKS